MQCPARYRKRTPDKRSTNVYGEVIIVLRILAISLTLSSAGSLAAGCDPSQQRNSTEVPPDTGSKDAESLTQLHIEERLRIGSVSGVDTGFVRIEAVDIRDDGQVFVFDSGTGNIKAYSRGGTLLYRFGGKGEGPGEFRGVTEFGVRGDTVWAIDQLNGRVTLFSDSGELLFARQFDPVPIPLQPVDRLQGMTSNALVSARNSVEALPGGFTAGEIVPQALLSDGLFITTLIERFGRRTRILQSDLAPTDTILIPRLRIDDRGVVIDTVGWLQRPPPEMMYLRLLEIGSAVHLVPPPPLDEPIRMTSENGSIVVDRRVAASAESASFSVTRLALSGDTVYSRRFHYRPRGYDGKLLDNLASTAARFEGGRPQAAITKVQTAALGRAVDPGIATRAHRRIREAMEFPPFQPPIQDVFLCDNGAVWLRREEDSTARYRWMVLDSAGEPRGEIAVPAEWRILWSDGSTIWVAEKDELDVEWLVQYIINPRKP